VIGIAEFRKHLKLKQLNLNWRKIVDIQKIVVTILETGCAILNCLSILLDYGQNRLLCQWYTVSVWFAFLLQVGNWLLASVYFWVHDFCMYDGFCLLVGFAKDALRLESYSCACNHYCFACYRRLSGHPVFCGLGGKRVSAEQCWLVVVLVAWGLRNMEYYDANWLGCCHYGCFCCCLVVGSADSKKSVQVPFLTESRIIFLRFCGILSGPYSRLTCSA